jgi:hypothetical protein
MARRSYDVLRESHIKDIYQELRVSSLMGSGVDVVLAFAITQSSGHVLIEALIKDRVRDGIPNNRRRTLSNLQVAELHPRPLQA